MKIRLSTKRVKEIIKEEFQKLRNEAAKPDFLDLDKDGNKEESMEDAADDKEEKEGDEKGKKKKKDLSKVPPQLRKSMEKKTENLKRIVREEIKAALK